MGACLSCLGLHTHNSNHANNHSETDPLLDPDDPYAPTNPNFRTFAAAHAHTHTSWGPARPDPPRDPDELRREQAAKDHIQRWASDQIVDVFPNMNVLTPTGAFGASMAAGVEELGASASAGAAAGLDASGSEDGKSAGAASTTGTGAGQLGLGTGSTHQDFLLSTIPGDRSKRSIRIYPPSRAGDTSSVRSGASGSRFGARKGGGRAVVKLNIDLP